jgi:glycine cleavage system H lipoate-binding protein
MTIALSCLIFLMFVLIAYLWMGRGWLQWDRADIRKQALVELDWETRIPQGYSFHVGHTWVRNEGGEQTRIGVDEFALRLLGEVDQIEVIGNNRWVRQGQRILTMQSDAIRVDFLSPVEGVITAVNEQAIKEPTLASRFPFDRGWIALIKAQEFGTQQKNLIRGEMAERWMHKCMMRVQETLAQADSLAANGRRRKRGLLARVTPELRQKLVKEFFQT